MELAINPYAFTLILSSLLVSGLSLVIGWKLEESVRWVALIMLSLSVWGFFYGMELLSVTLEDMFFWTKLEYIGLLLAPSSWVIFAIKYNGVNTSGKPWIYPAIFFLPIVTYLILLTNEIHHLHYKNIWVITDGPFPIIGIEKGPWYFVQICFTYFYYFLGTFIFLRRFKFTNSHFRAQTKLLIIGGIFPLIVNVFYQLSWIKPFAGLDMTPFAFLFTYIIVAIAILRFNLLNLKPIARDKILEVLTRGILIVDHRNKIIDFNSAITRYFPKINGLKVGNAADSVFADFPQITELLQVKEPKTVECTVNSPSGEAILKIETIPIANNKALVSGVLLLFDDITKEIQTNEKLKKQASELQQLNDLKDKFFSIISHDLKGPIFGVKELIHLTQNGLISEEEFLDMLPEVSKNMEHVAILLENLLAWTSSQLRGEFYQPQDLDLNKLVTSQKSLLDRIAKEKSIQIELDIAENSWVRADKNMLELILRNLIGNAIKFSHPGSKIEVSVTESEGMHKLCVKDYGVGISDEILEKLNQGISVSTRGQSNESGTGLGLLLVREYIQKSGGKLSISSKLGEGTKFCVTITKAAAPIPIS